MPLVTVTLTTALFTHSRTLSISNESTPRPTNLKQEVGLLKPKVALLYRRMVLVCLRYPHLPAAIPLHQSAIIGSPLIGISDRSPHWLLILSQIPPRGSNSGCILSPPFDPRLHRRSVDWPLAVIYITTWPHLVATHLFYCLPGMLWSVDGWNRSNDISNLPCRRTVAAEGTASLLLSSALSCHTTKDPLFSLSPFSLECSPSFHIQGITKIEMLVLANQSEPSLG
ncbi:uncharacterized protein LOC103502803 isoform X1 [Cucumis melo]|uniref:Uncharacterized protein LOC103502803 isoform X1 n=1 Tax=Cucumis melo TaxID=3656 RepID=A0ABM3L2Q7_CUCME|nr:uncharacterized protein LOC103502803 isoform X1 [Cucumis melo]